MEIQVKREDLVRELGLADRIISRKSVIPVCGSVLIRAEADGSVTVASTDTEVGLTGHLPATVRQPGAKAIQAGKLFDLAKSLPEGDVVLGEAGDQAVLAGAGFRARLAAFPTDDFPALAQPEGAYVSLPGPALLALVKRVRFAVAANDRAYFLNGALLEIATGSLRMVATDSHRLALADAVVETSANGSVPVLVPAKTLNLLAEMLDGHEGPVEYTSTAQHLFFRVGSRLLLSRQIDGKFPNYERIIPKAKVATATIQRAPLTDALRRSQLLDTAHRRTVFAFSAGNLKLSAKSADVGDGEETIAADYSGPALTMALNAGYVLDFLESVSSDAVEFEAQSAQHAAVFRPVDGSGMYVVMPLSI